MRGRIIISPGVSYQDTERMNGGVPNGCIFIGPDPFQ